MILIWRILMCVGILVVGYLALYFIHRHDDDDGYSEIELTYDDLILSQRKSSPTKIILLTQILKSLKGDDLDNALRTEALKDLAKETNCDLKALGFEK